jgi:phosphomannomutase
VSIPTIFREKGGLGVAFDGDAARLGAVDEKGNVLWGDQSVPVLRFEAANPDLLARAVARVDAAC